MPAAGSPPPSSRNGHAAWPAASPRPGSTGDRLLTSAESSAELVVAHVAALRLGLVVVPVNGAYREREIAHIVRDARPSAALVDDRERGDGSRGRPPRRACSSSGRRSSSPTAMPRPRRARARRRRDALLHVGHDRHPQGCAPDPRQRALEPRGVAAGVAVDPDDRLVLALPLFHMHGLGVGLHGTLLSGASVVLQPKFDPDAVLDAAPAEQATLFFGVPTMYDRLARRRACRS